MTERNFEIARGVRITSDPDTLSRDQVIDELYEIGNYASSLQIQMRALRSVLQNALRKKDD